MSDIDQIIQRLLGEAVETSSVNAKSRYHSAFDHSGVSKANDIILELNRQNVDLSRLAYLSIGGSSGSEIIHVLSTTSMRYGVLLEYNDLAAADASKNANKMIPSKSLKVICGDATQKIDICKKILLDLRKSGDIDGIVCSIQAVLHELPTRSPQHEVEYLLGEALWDWVPCFFFCREPCAPPMWPEIVKLAIDDISSSRLEDLANHIRGMLAMPGMVKRAGPKFVMLNKDLAVELLFKIFYIHDYSYEIQERVTSLNAIVLEKIVRGILEQGEVDCKYLNSDSFSNFYKKLNVVAKDKNEGYLNPPLTFVQIIGRRIASINNNETIKSLRTTSCSRHTGGVCESVKLQVERILNLSLLPWSPRKSLSLRVLWPELLIDPELIPHKNSITPLRLTEWIKNLKWTANIALIGQPGAGKSTGLRRIFLDLVERIEVDGSPFPVLGHISDYIQYIESKSSFDIFTKAIIEAKSSQKSIVYLVDGLDEIDPILAEIFFNKFVLNLSNNEFIWCACRTEYFFNQLGAQIEFTQHFREVLEFCPWAEQDVLLFVEQYAKRLELPGLLSRFANLLDAVPEAKDLSKNPFQLTLILYILSGGVETNSKFENSYSLYDSFYYHWLRREIQRGTSLATESEVRRIHLEIAEKLFDLRCISVQRNIHVDDTTRIKIASNTAIADLLKIERSPDQIRGFRHETIGEYLLAHHIVEALIDKNSKLEDILLRTYTFEINRFVREAINLFNDNDREYLIDLLSCRYAQYGINKTSVHTMALTTDELRIKEQILYYIGRIPSQNLPSILKKHIILRKIHY